MNRDNQILNEIRLILLDNLDNPCGGLFNSEIQQNLADRGIHISPQKICLLIRHRGKHIKTHPVQVGSKWLNLYYTYPPLDLNSEDPQEAT